MKPTPHLDLLLAGWPIARIATYRGIDPRDAAVRIGREIDQMAKDMGGRFR